MGIKEYVWADDFVKPPDTDRNHIFIGDEGCGRFMESGTLSDYMKNMHKKGIPVGIITPFLMPEREKRLISFLEQLEKQTEVVVNDIGSFCLVKGSGHTPIIGRLLTKQKTDPSIHQFYHQQPERKILVNGEKGFLRYAPPSETLSKYFRDIPIFSEMALEVLLKDRDRIMVMLDMPPHGMPETVPGGVEVMLSGKNVLVSMLPCVNCAACPQEETYIGTNRSGIPIYRKRNTCYYKQTGMAGKFQNNLPHYVSRILS